MKSKDLDDLFKAILALESEEECYRFFDDLCTIPELKSIAQRWIVAKELDAGTTYQEICQITKASTATISRVNRALSYGSGGGYQMMLKKLKKDQ